MNAISISLFAIVITAALALVAPVTHYVQHEQAVLSAHGLQGNGNAAKQSSFANGRWV
jgi:hypothetical protein